MAEVLPQETELVIEGESSEVSADGYSYKIDLYTGDAWRAGTDANVLVTIFGENGDSGQRILNNSGNVFERDSTDSFKIVSSSYLGPIKKIIIAHDNSGLNPSWFLNKVTVEDVKSREVFEFPCRRWLATDEDDGLISRELLWSIVKVKEKETRENYPYTINIYTGTAWGAGTDANVYITVYGTNSRSRKCKLKNKGHSTFESGMKDTCKLETKNPLGTLYKIRVGHDNTGLGPGWLLDKIEVEDDITGEIIKFACGKWLSTTSEDGLICRDLMRKGFVEEDEPSLETVAYTVNIFTGHKWGAGTDANVFLTLYGTNGESPQQKIENEGSTTFENGMTDTYKFDCPYLGTLTKIRIGHDNTGWGPAWYLDKVTVEDTKNGDVVEFPCSRWLATNADDGMIERELVRKDGSQVDGKKRQIDDREEIKGNETQEVEERVGEEKETEIQPKKAKNGTKSKKDVKKEIKEKEKQQLQEKAGEGKETEKRQKKAKDRSKSKKDIKKEKKEKERQQLKERAGEKKEKEKEKPQTKEKESELLEEFLFFTQEPTLMVELESGANGNERREIETKELKEKPIMEEMIQVQEEGTVMANNFDGIEREWLEKERQEKEKQALLEKERQEKEKQELLEKERQEKKKQELLEKERQEKEKQALLEKERQEKEKRALLEKERKEKEKRELLEKERKEKEKQALLEKERQEKEKQALLEKERQEKKKQALLEKERQEKEKQALREKERQEKEKQALLEKERQEKEKQELLEKERQEKEKQELLEKERHDKEKRALLEKERQEKEKQARLEKERKEKEKQALLEKERQEKEKQALLEKERQEKEKQEILEKERQEKEKQALLEKERKEKEKQALLEKERQEKEKQALLEKERKNKSELWKQQDIKVTFQNMNVPANLKSKALGMESGDIKDKQITASSHTKVTHPSWVRLNHPSSWCAGKLHSSWLQVDLESPHWVTAVATQGNPKGYKDYVKKLKIQHSQDGKIWTTYEENGNQIFDANVDYTTIKTIELQKVIFARYIRICPLEWHVWPCMRMELYGSPLTKDEELRKS